MMMLALTLPSPLRLLVLLALIGVVAWLLVTYVPMPAVMKTIIVVAAVFAVVIAANALGVF
jgi:hypothetical protein